MKIVIIGAGDVGSFLAQYLCRDENELILVDIDPTRLKALSDRLDLAAWQGSATSLSLLEEAGVRGADYFIAATSIDEINAFSCSVAAKLDVKHRIARIRDDEFASEVIQMGLADTCVNPEKECARAIVELVMHSGLKDFQKLADGRILMLSLDVIADSVFADASLANIAQKLSHISFRVVALLRGGISQIPSGNVTLLPGDTITFSVGSIHAVELVQASGVTDGSSHDVMILGTTPIALEVAQSLKGIKGMNIKIFQTPGENERSAQVVAEQLDHVMAFETGGKEIDTMAMESLGDMDTFLALTEEEEKNIITSLVAKHLGVQRTITMIHKSEYMPIVKTIGLDIGINKRITTAQEILKHVHRGRMRDQVQLPGAGVNLISFVVGRKSKHLGKPVSRLSLPKDCILAAIQRVDSAFVPIGDSRLEAGDLVTVVTLDERQQDVEKCFA